MPQFTPAPRDEVLEAVKAKYSVGVVFETSNAIVCEIHRQSGSAEVYGDLTRKFGWCVQVERYKDVGPNTLILEPITGVDR